MDLRLRTRFTPPTNKIFLTNTSFYIYYTERYFFTFYIFFMCDLFINLELYLYHNTYIRNTDTLKTYSNNFIECSVVTAKNKSALEECSSILCLLYDLDIIIILVVSTTCTQSKERPNKTKNTTCIIIMVYSGIDFLIYSFDKLHLCFL